MTFAVYCFFASILVLVSIRSLLDGVAYRHFLVKDPSVNTVEPQPFVTVIAPCKGVDQGLDVNLQAILSQQYPHYETLFVVDDLDDPAVPVIEALIGSRSGAKLVVASTAVDSSQKVENLREAVLHASESSEVFVFVDSDARPGPSWLSHLVRPLFRENIGASTGYRWFISPSGNLASQLRSAWNASIASALGPKFDSNFCWGGSTAIRRDLFDRLRMRDRWEGTLSDDFVMTAAIKEAGLGIAFVPQALSASVEECSFSDMVEFTTRQLKITRVYSPGHWAVSFIGSALFVSVMLGSIVILAMPGSTSLARIVAAAVVVSVSLLTAVKAWIRVEAVRVILSRYDSELRRDRSVQALLCLFTPLIFLYNCICAPLSREIHWRGIRYKLKSRTETVIIRD